ncbi:hypothetical protein OI18_12185 [Flavihumibacter solisilvae]|uniref:Uncharacterized protein n=2 Tax=Flavihumibacter solisilvae TaxID=1349421 RepID=A0A0C1LG90_9BACT|nr:hypothetical protein OI18_12185 [Flavihumibacter solisilvae]
MYLGWSIIHAAFFIFWLVLFFLGARLVRKQYGTWLYAVMIAGIVGLFVGGGGQYRRDSAQKSSASEQVFLEDFSVFSLLLNTYFDRDSANAIQPVHQDVIMNGLISGFIWQTQRIDLKPAANDGNRFTYNVSGSLKWKLLGLTVFTEAKTYRGFITAPYR